ncbi:MAG: hypothetical protein GX033_03960 [Firmicutes bacterium]|nr:hypothetical protein [Bacillota bacterium]
MQTRKLYYRDPYLHTFKAKVVAVKPGWIALDQTAFYPEGGGQPADQGWLQGQRVTDVQIDEQEVVWHKVDLDTEIGVTVEGRLDWLRRFDHMQQHTAQHVLSQAFWQLFKAETVGFHLGEQNVTIDLAGTDLDEEALVQAEALTNAKLRGRIPVRSYEVAAEMLPTQLLRKLPQVEGDIRLVQIGDFDLCPCGGTHVRDLGEIGLLKVLGSEKKRGNTRVIFLAGRRAYEDYNHKHKQLTALSAMLSEPTANVEAAVERLLQRLQELEREEKGLRKQLLVYQGQELLATAQDLDKARAVVQELPGHSLDEARFLASYLAEQGPHIVLFGIPDEPYRLVAAVNAGLKLAIGPLLKEVVVKYEGRGGGSATSAQGAVPPAMGAGALAELIALCRQVLS